MPASSIPPSGAIAGSSGDSLGVNFPRSSATSPGPGILVWFGMMASTLQSLALVHPGPFPSISRAGARRVIHRTRSIRDCMSAGKNGEPRSMGLPFRPGNR